MNAAPAAPAAKPRKRRKRKIAALVAGAFLAVHIAFSIYHTNKALPAGLSMEGPPVAVADGDLEFLCDVTFQEDGRRAAEQAIFDRVLSLVRGAEDFVLLDVFLFNSYRGREGGVHRKLCGEVTDALIGKKEARPGISIVVITDPVNEVYGGCVPPEFARLRAAGIPVVITGLDRLRDSNPLWSSFWRMCVAWMGNSPGGIFPHPFSGDSGGVGARSWLALLNFKANHRKVVIADAAARAGGRELTALVMSANPHDASSAHGNTALLARGGVCRDLLRSEQAVLDFSAPAIRLASRLPGYARGPAAPSPAGRTTVRAVTEEKIRTALLAEIDGAASGDSIDVAMFYLSEQRAIRSIAGAASRGAGVRLLLDPNRDAFGYEKDGVPNRPVATRLVRDARSAGEASAPLDVRWYDTRGEQFHAKTVIVRKADGRAVLFLGSANLTRRNLGDLNLETDLVVSGDSRSPAIAAAIAWFERLWSNRDHAFSVPFETYADDSSWKYGRCRFQEWSGCCSF